MTYRTGPLSSVDWVAGGNYDGYVYEYELIIENDKAWFSQTILDQSRYDGYAKGWTVRGAVNETDPRAIVISFQRDDGMKLRLRRLEGGKNVFLSGNLLYNDHRFTAAVTFFVYEE